MYIKIQIFFKKSIPVEPIKGNIPRVYVSEWGKLEKNNEY